MNQEGAKGVEEDWKLEVNEWEKNSKENEISI
jgi:hypothetical protein